MSTSLAIPFLVDRCKSARQGRQGSLRLAAVFDMRRSPSLTDISIWICASVSDLFLAIISGVLFQVGLSVDTFCAITARFLPCSVPYDPNQIAGCVVSREIAYG